MKQYFSIKAKYPDAVLLFRVGDFYETYGKDAILAAEILNIALTFKTAGKTGKIEMAGFPFHALDTYLPKLVKAGKRVAICDQLEDPKKTKTLVKRGVTELVTPGVSTNEAVLDHGENNFLAALHLDQKRAGVAFLDISTGEFITAEGSFEYVDKLLSSFNPKEILYERSKRSLFQDTFHYNGPRFEMEDWVYTDDSAQRRLLKQFQTVSLKGFGIQNMPLAIIASASVLYYMDMTQHLQLGHIQQISRIDEDNYVRLDRYTIRNLELCNTINQEGKSLLEILDKTCTPMGKRQLRRWILFPLKDIKAIEARQEVVEFFMNNKEIHQYVKERLSLVGDLERIVSKVAVGRVSPREVVHLKNALMSVADIKQYLNSQSLEITPPLRSMIQAVDTCEDLCLRIAAELVENPPIALNRGEVIRAGVNEELDQLRNLSTSGKEYLQRLQERESQKTGISSLKVSFNNVFGYYMEVRNVHKDKVPENWIRKQTLVSAERYITPELKEYEEKILGAEERISQIESDIFNALVLDLVSFVNIIQNNAVQLSQLDCLLSFAEVSSLNNYHKPQLSDSDEINIKAGRHPVIEKQLPDGEIYISNDVFMDNKSEQILIITGPNMAGKSALIRQTALIVIMAQTGCFVPADEAQIGLVDKVFTRVGASDNLSLGESTFMVEMLEAADILNNITPRSLVLFDELGRGTSTYDGISIAWAIVEYIHEQPKARAKTLFATHYHELNEMEKTFPRIRNYHISVKEADNKVIFLRKMRRGGSEHSFGIHVAKMAGMPPSIVNRANQILQEFETSQQGKVPAKPVSRLAETREGLQLSFFQLDDPVLSQVRDEILKVDINNLTPIEALNKLNEIKKIVKGRG
jgi:DNA mismatch repair protein MutS